VTTVLLCHMRQLVGKQPASLSRPPRKPALIKDNVLSYRVGKGVNVTRRLVGGRTGMNAHLTEVVAKSRLEERARCRIERLPRLPQHLVHDKRRLANRARR